MGVSEGGEITEPMVLIIDLPGHGIDVCYSTKAAHSWHRDCGSV